MKSIRYKFKFLRDEAATQFYKATFLDLSAGWCCFVRGIKLFNFTIKSSEYILRIELKFKLL